MSDTPQIYLITPASFDLQVYPDQLATMLDAHDIACVRLVQASADASDIGRSADRLRDVCHARDVALVIDSHFRMVEAHGLDGVHLHDAARLVRDVRKDLGDDAIIGTYCGASQHAGMNAGEASADYVSFGPVAQSELGDGTVAEQDLFEWWSQVVEVPVVAEGNVSLDLAKSLAPHTDFFALGAEIWGSDDPKAALDAYIKAIS